MRKGLIKRVEKSKKYMLSRLKNNENFEVEKIMEETGFEKRIIHRAISQLRQLSGWSIIPHNEIPRGRAYGRSRDRKKGERYEHDYFEPDWKRTMYTTRRPKTPEEEIEEILDS